MATSLNSYLENVRNRLKLDIPKEKEIITELETHIEDSLQELKEAGLPEDEAARTCLGLLGSARLIARQIYEAHSQGTWKQALLAATPHLLFGLLFALNWWHYIGWLMVLTALIFGAAVYGWWHGKPAWVFPWLGYSLIPVLATGLLLIYLPTGWSLITIPLYFPLALWWLYFIISRTARRDWLYGSLTLLPLPIIIGWFITVAPAYRLDEAAMQRSYALAPWISLSFVVLALTIIAFVRSRQRWLRTSLLILSALLTMTVITYYARGELSITTFIGIILITWGIFLIPPLLERLARSRGWTRKTWQ